MKKRVGPFERYLAAIEYHTVAADLEQRRISNLSVSSFVAQWVPATSAKGAEDSFFTINDAATPLDKTEKRIIRSRGSAAAIASRAISHGGGGHAYWAAFPEAVQAVIEKTASGIYDQLYRPPLANDIVDTLDVPVAGRGYSVLPFVFDLVNQVNGTKAGDSTGARTKDDFHDDVDGSETTTYLKRVSRTVDRITGKEPTSLGLHPVVYFYTRGGAFSPWAFLAWARIIDKVFANGEANRFCDIRADLERFLIENKWSMTEIIHKNGSGDRSTPWLERYWSLVVDSLSDGKSLAEVAKTLNDHKDFAALQFKDPMLRMPSAERQPGGGKIASKTKTAAIWDAALPGAPKCPYCGGLFHRNSFHGDHITPKREGGDNRQTNTAIAHPYCDATYKDAKKM